MSDIFISYASGDRDKARTLAEFLRANGWSVWWDRAIPPGREFDEVIEEALDSAKCVVVLWSKSAAASRWVKTEAEVALRRNVLVPVLIEQVTIPLEFRLLQAADLSRLQDPKSPQEPATREQLDALVRSIAELAAPNVTTPQPPISAAANAHGATTPPSAPSTSPQTPSDPAAGKHKAKRIALWVVITLAVLVSLLYLISPNSPQ